jgi:hypothetical protein
VRYANAIKIDEAIQDINLGFQGHVVILEPSQPVLDEYRTVHQSISSQEVCAVARRIIALGGEPIRLPEDGTFVWLSEWQNFLLSRLAIADGEELDLCLSALQMCFDMLPGWSPWRNVVGMPDHRWQSGISSSPLLPIATESGPSVSAMSIFKVG